MVNTRGICVHCTTEGRIVFKAIEKVGESNICLTCVRALLSNLPPEQPSVEGWDTASLRRIEKRITESLDSQFQRFLDPNRKPFRDFPMSPEDEAGRDWFRESVGNLRVRFWICPIAEHANRRGVTTVVWDGDIASCTVDGCDKRSDWPNEPTTEPTGETP